METKQEYKQLTEEQITESLTGGGWKLDTEIKDPGGYYREAVWQFRIVSPNGSEHRGTYTTGSAYREWFRWLPPAMGYEAYFGKYRKGARVSIPFNAPQLKDVESNKEVLHAFNMHTRPIKPTLADVLYSIVSDSLCVCDGQTHAGFCDDFGYDADSIKQKKCYEAIIEENQFLLRAGQTARDLWDKYFQDF